ANETRDWHIYAELAQRLIVQARKLYSGEDFGLELTNTVYALDSTTIDLCLSVFPWAHFRTTKAAVKMHTLLDLRGPRPADPGTRRHLCHGSRLCRFCPPSCDASGWCFLRDTRQIEHEFPSALFGSGGSHDRHCLRSDHCPGRPLRPAALSRASAAHPLQGCRDIQDVGISDQQLRSAGIDYCRPLQK